MSRPSIKWGQCKRYFDRNGYTVYGSGGDKIVVAPKNGSAARSRQTVTIGHKCCSHSGSEVWACYLNAIERAFGVTRNDILNG